ncbi:TPA: hypothetical protein QH850_002771 [Enterobacter chengduensis]|nr:hypothetical protein [Enterobacter chengduensis]
MKCKLIACLSGILLTAHAAAETTDWQIAKPYADNPLVTATLTGKGVTGEHQGEVQLVVICRKDAPPAFAALRADAAISDHFPVWMFEGPDSKAEHYPLLASREDRQSWLSSGSVQEKNHFEWTFTPDEMTLQRWARAGGAPLTLVVTTPDNNHSLTARFTLPASKTLNETLAPCMK